VPVGDVDVAVNNRGSETFGIAGVVRDGSARFGTNPDTFGIVVVEGLTNEGNARFGASSETFGTDGTETSGTEAVGIDGVVPGVVEGLTKEGNARFGASPETFGMDGATKDTTAGRLTPLKGSKTEGVVDVGTLTPEPKLDDVPTGIEDSPSGTSPKRPRTNPVTPPT
jgi:hypothetical protein